MMWRGRSSANKLNDELLTLILIRLPLNCLHRYKCVSKSWYTLISDPYFISQYIESHKNSFHHDHFIVHANPFFDFISLGHQNQLPKQTMDFSLKSIPNPGDWFASLENNFNILATSNGLLLCNGGGIFYVGNPLTKEWLALPRLRYPTSQRVIGFLCYPTDSISSKPHFIVLLVDFKSILIESFDTDVFVSNTGKWERHQVICPPGYRGGELVWREQPAVIYNNIFHWRSRNNAYIVAYDPINQPCDCKPIPFPIHSSVGPMIVHHMELSDDGHIRMICSERNSGFFHVWELTNYDKGVWNMKYHVKSPNDFTINNINAFLSQTNGEIVYLIHKSTKKLMVLNMKNGLPEQVIDLPVNFGQGDPYGRTMAFVATPWPTPVPQLPILNLQDYPVSRRYMFF